MIDLIVEAILAGNQAVAKDDARCLAQAVFFEARGEPVRSQRLVAQTVIDWASIKGTSVCGAVDYKGRHPWAKSREHTLARIVSKCAAELAAWRGSVKLAVEMLVVNVEGSKCALHKGSRCVERVTHFHDKSVTPYWAGKMVVVADIGSMVFYRDPSITSDTEGM